MKKMKLTAILLGAMALTISASATEPVKLTLDQLKKIQSEQKILQNPGVAITKGYDRVDLGIIQLRTTVSGPRGSSSIPAFLVKGKNIMFTGTAYVDGKPLKMPAEKVLVTPAVAFSYGTGEKSEMYLFTDPECPACINLEKRAGEKLEKHKVNVVLFPLVRIHDKATPMTQWVLRGKTDQDRADRLKKVMNHDTAWYADIGFNEKTFTADYQEYKFAMNLSMSKASAADLERVKEVQKKYFIPGEMQNLKDYLRKARVAFNEIGAKGTPTLKAADLSDFDYNSL